MCALLLLSVEPCAREPESASVANQNPPNRAVTEANRKPSPAEIESSKLAGQVSLMSNREFWLSSIILLFGVFIIIVEYFLLRTVVQEKTEEIARIYTVTLIIIGTLVLISSGFTNQQIAPALGLFGTIAGYLLGRSDARVRSADEREGGKDEKK
jgi:membrane protease YdiL (CAAX protease family)